MSDKYPSVSPYTYCANNPVKLVDPNGEEMIVPDDRPFGRSNFEQPPTQSLSLSNNNFKGGYGFSLDLNLTFIMGFSMEVGFVADGSGNGSMYFSRGWSTGVEASIGLNGFYIPNRDFNIDCFKGKSESLSISFKNGLGVSLFSDYSAGEMKDYFLNDYLMHLVIVYIHNENISSIILKSSWVVVPPSEGRGHMYTYGHIISL